MPIKVFIVEDSCLQVEVITRELSRDGDIQVIGTAAGGDEALLQIPLFRPDVVVMDACLPDRSGPAVTARLLEIYPVPVILFTESPDEFQDRAELSGVVATVSKRSDDDEPIQILARMIRLMNGMKVVKRKPQSDPSRGSHKRYLLIGSSSGGAVVVRQLLSEISPRDDLAVIVVQHLSQHGTGSFADWLESSTSWPCRVCEQGEVVQPGHVYLGPAGFQMRWSSGLLTLRPSNDAIGFAPSVDELFSSFSNAVADQVIAVILSGIGRDGARGLLELRLAGAVTIVQDPTSAAVSGMPGSAVLAGGALQTVPTDRLGKTVLTYLLT